MTWFKVDDGFLTNPKTAMLSNDALALWLRSGVWSCAQMTDGVVPARMVAFLRGTDGAVAELVDAGLWERDGEAYRFHDWHDYQPSSEAVVQLREKRREAGRKGGLKSARTRWGAGGDATENYVVGSGGGKQNGKQVLKQNGKQVLKQNGKQVLKQNVSKPQAKSNPVPVPVPDISYSPSLNVPRTDAEPAPPTSPAPSEPTPTATGEPLWGEIVTTGTDVASPMTRPDWDRVVDDIGAFWPVNKFDGRVRAVRMRVEAALPAIVRAARREGRGDDPGGFLAAKARAYCAATEPRFTVRFSRFVGEEYFARDWVPGADAPAAQPSRRESNKAHNAQVIISLMTPEERAEYEAGRGILHDVAQ